MARITPAPPRPQRRRLRVLLRILVLLDSNCPFMTTGPVLTYAGGGGSIMLRLLADLFGTEPARVPSSHIKRTTERSGGGGATLCFNGNNKLLSQAIKSASDTYQRVEVRRAI